MMSVCGHKQFRDKKICEKAKVLQTFGFNYMKVFCPYLKGTYQ